MADDKTIAAFHELERSRYAKLRQAVEEHKATVTRAGEVMFCDLIPKHLISFDIQWNKSKRAPSKRSKSRPRTCAAPGSVSWTRRSVNWPTRGASWQSASKPSSSGRTTTRLASFGSGSCCSQTRKSVPCTRNSWRRCAPKLAGATRLAGAAA